MSNQGNHVLADVLTTGKDAEPVIDANHQRLSVALAREDGKARATLEMARDTGLNSSETVGEDGYIYPTEEEKGTLRIVAGKVPLVAYTLCAVEFAERASYYGCSQVFNNFIEYPLPKNGNGAGAPPKGTQETAGALGQGLQVASALTLLFSFLAYTVPLLGGWLADVKWGRYRTICIGVAICGIAHIIMVFGAMPVVLKAGHGMAPFVVSLIILAFGAGLFKCNIAPLIIDQYPHHKQYINVLPSGERVIVDPETTVQRVMLTFYMLVNIGAFFGLATTYSEKLIGYWLAYLIPCILYLLTPIVLVLAYKKTIKKPPTGSDLTNVLKIVSIAFKTNWTRVFRHGFWEGAKPTVLAAKGITEVPWTDDFVDDVSRTFSACQIFLFFPIFNLNDGGIGAIQTSQAAAMVTDGAPNDLLSNFNPLTIIVLIPILNYGFYPFLRKHKIHFGRISRITFGFLLAAASSVVGAILQWRVYVLSPCGYYATSCDIGTGVANISVWTQIPLYVLSAAGECFANVTAYEVAYARSPPNMKGLVMALFLFTTAISSALGEACTAALVDPHLIWPFAGTAIAGVVSAVVFWFLYHHMDHDEFMSKTNQEGYVPEPVHGDIESVEQTASNEIDEKRVLSSEGEKTS